MKKIEQIFNNIILQKIGGNNEHPINHYLAEEAKDIAIGFANWYYYNKETHKYDSELFDEFLKEEYD